MEKYRVVIADWQSAFNETVRSPAVQVRVGLFWWVTLTHCESISQARTYISNIKNKKADVVVSVL